MTNPRGSQGGTEKRMGPSRLRVVSVLAFTVPASISCACSDDLTTGNVQPCAPGTDTLSFPSVPVSAPLALETGWPIAAGASQHLIGPVLADVYGNGTQEVVAVDDTGRVFVWTHEGSRGATWEAQTHGASNPAPSVGNLDAEADLEIVIGATQPTRGRKLFAFKPTAGNAPIWTQTRCGSLQLKFLSSPATIASVDGASNRVYVTTGNRAVCGFASDGTVLPGWPSHTHTRWTSAVSVGNLDSDPELEVVATDEGPGQQRGNVYAWDSGGKEAWSARGQGVTPFAVALGDLADEDGISEGVVNYPRFGLYMIHANGTQERVTREVCGFGGPFLVNLDDDPAPEVVLVATIGFRVTARAFDREPGGNWSTLWTYSVPHRPSRAVYSGVAGDIDGDGAQEIVFTLPLADGSYVYALRRDGSDLPGFPMQLSVADASVPALGDVDNDRHLELVLQGTSISDRRSEYYLFEFALETTDDPELDWPMFHQNPGRTSCYRCLKP